MKKGDKEMKIFCLNMPDKIRAKLEIFLIL